MENKQTAVEWLMTQLPMGLKITIADKLEAAKQMEKEQIIDAYTIGSYDMAEKEFRPEQYYTKTYGR